MKALHFISALALSLAFTAPADAADPSTIMGKWITRSPDGKALITEFSPTSMAYYPVDEAGKPLGEPKKTGATYKDLSGENIAVTVDGGGPGIIIQRNGEKRH